MNSENPITNTPQFSMGVSSSFSNGNDNNTHSSVGSSLSQSNTLQSIKVSHEDSITDKLLGNNDNWKGLRKKRILPFKNKSNEDIIKTIAIVVIFLLLGIIIY